MNNTLLLELHKQFASFLQSSGRAHATVIAYSKDVEQIIQFFAEKGKTEVTDVTADEIEEFKELLKKQRYTDKSISRKINSVKAFFRYAIREGHITENPADVIVHPKYDQSPPRVLSKLEHKQTSQVRLMVLLWIQK